MKSLTVRNVEIGAGVPKTIVPIVAKTRDGIIDKAREITTFPADCVEWRADFYEDLQKPEALAATLKDLRKTLGNIPLLFTIRTKPEGGEIDIDPAKYTAINLAVAKSGDADMVDVEMCNTDAVIKENIDGIHAAKCLVIGSKHDFKKTPDKAFIIATLKKAQDFNSDISKIAVMPNSNTDVVTLLDASSEFYAKIADRPILTISMGAIGMISRMACELSGSCMTFGAAGQVSAPGQIQVKDLKDALSLIYRSTHGA